MTPVPGPTRERVAAVFSGGRQGSGYLLSPYLVLTAAHVIQDAEDIRAVSVGGNGQKRCEQLWSWQNDACDVALLLADEPLTAVDTPWERALWGELPGSPRSPTARPSASPRPARQRGPSGDRAAHRHPQARFLTPPAGPLRPGQLAPTARPPSRRRLALGRFLRRGRLRGRPPGRHRRRRPRRLAERARRSHPRQHPARDSVVHQHPAATRRTDSRHGPGPRPSVESRRRIRDPLRRIHREETQQADDLRNRPQQLTRPMAARHDISEPRSDGHTAICGQYCPGHGSRGGTRGGDHGR